MNFISLDPDKHYYCELILDSQADPSIAHLSRTGGTIRIASHEIKLNLFSFDYEVRMPEDISIEVRIETNWTVSLFDTFESGGGSIGMLPKSTHHSAYFSNTAVVGPDAWAATDRVRRTQFRIKGIERFLSTSSTFITLSNSKISEHPNECVFSEPVSGSNIKLLYHYTGILNSDYPREIWPVIDMEFDEGLSLEDCRKRTLMIVRFMSAISCRYLRAQDQVISRLNYDNWVAALNDRIESPEYSLYMYYNDKEEQKYGESNFALYSAFALLNNDIELRTFVACLRVWINRNIDWEAATSAMMEAFALRNVISPERLLNATKWIEATPGTSPVQAIVESDVVKLVDVIGNAAIEMGYDAIKDRLKGALRRISNEANIVRFRRIVGELKNIYGGTIVDDNLADWVNKAFSLRGYIAHRPIVGITESEIQEFLRATQAAECLAYLLITRDLPLTDEGRMRVGECEIVAQYKRNVMGHMPLKAS